LQVFSDLGGFKNFVFTLAIFFGKYYSQTELHSKLINSLYFSKSQGKMDLKAKDKFKGKSKQLFEKA
jgi:hypothetical protein